MELHGRQNGETLGRAAKPVAALAIALACLCGPASAQRNGDVSGAKNNQPTQGEVQNREQAGGVTPAPAQQQQRAGAVDDLYRDLMRKERSDGMTSAPTDPNAATAPTPAPGGTRP